MNNALSTDDVTDLGAIKVGGTNPDGSPRYLRATELEDGGARLIGFGLAQRVGSHVALTVAGTVEAEERGI
jgi:hypothetical protein